MDAPLGLLQGWGPTSQAPLGGNPSFCCVSCSTRFGVLRKLLRARNLVVKIINKDDEEQHFCKYQRISAQPQAWHKE